MAVTGLLLFLKQSGFLLKWFLPILFVCCTFNVPGQPYAFQHLNTGSGLLSDQRLVMTEDRLGRLWIGSDEGINVFDGYELSAYAAPGPANLAANRIFNVYCDTPGTIWISTPNGIQFRRETDNQFYHSPDAGGNVIKTGVQFMEHPGLGLLAIGAGKCFQLNRSTMQWQPLAQLSAIVAQYQQPLTVTPVTKDLWLWGCTGHVLLVDVARQKLVKTYNYRNAWALCKVNDTSFLAGSFAKDTVALIHLLSGAQQSLNGRKTSSGKLFSGYAGAISALGNNRFAIASRYYGLYIVDMARQQIQHEEHDPANPASITTNFLRSSFVTRNGSLFVHGRGLSYTRLQRPQFNAIHYLINAAGVQYDGAINAFLRNEDQTMWLGTNNGIALYETGTNKCTYYPFEDKAAAAGRLRTVRGIVKDSRQRIWAGSFGGGLGLMLPGKGFKQFKYDSLNKASSLPNNDIYNITQLSPDSLLISTNGGICIFDAATRRFTTFFDHPQLKPAAADITYQTYIDVQGNWWIAQQHALWYYQRRSGNLQKVHLPGQENTMVYTVTADSSGHIYAGTAAGLYIIDKNNLRIRRKLQKQDGLASDFIAGLVTDQSGDVWICGNRGLARYKPAANTLQTFDVKDGLIQSNHKFSAWYIDAAGIVYVGAEDGFNYFYPFCISNKPVPLSVWITSLQSDDSTLVTNSAKAVVLPGTQNNITLNYLVADFNLGQYVQYRYRLYGFDSGFVHAGKQRLARYTNLAYGKYRFEVQASVNGKDWYSAAAPLNIEIEKRWWQTWWVRVLAAALFSLAVYGIFYLRVKKIRREQTLKAEYEQKMAGVQMNLLRAQMNPHFIYNSLNSINSFILKNDRMNASGYLTKFSRLMRLILDNSRNDWVTLDSELKAIELYVQLEALRFNNAFGYDLQVEAAIDKEKILLPPLLLQPYIENAIWHGLMYRKEPGGLLQINVSQQNGHLLVCIKDNGVGREAAMQQKSKSALQQKSYGMKITDERIRAVNEIYQVNAHADITDLQTDTGLPGGTEVLLTLDKVTAR